MSRAASADVLAGELSAALGADAVSVELAARRAASTDHAWLSPVLSSRLPDVPADVVAVPGTVAGIAASVRAAATHGVPLTPRGKGTGNYGQAVPLDGGLALDCSRCDRVLDVSAGAIHAEAGASFTRLELAARATGQELAMFPSTVGSTIGGFVAGGAGGTGSIEHGLLWDGFVLGASVLPCLPDAEPVRLGPHEVGSVLHAYGTTGVLTDVVARLVPARTWTALWASFPTWAEATAAGLGLMATLDVPPRLLSIDDPAVVALAVADDAAPAGRVSLRAIVELGTETPARVVVAEHGGTVEAVRRSGTGALTSLSFNHVTLRAKRAPGGADLCHVQVGGPVLASAHDAVVACLPGGGLHLDGMGRPTGSDLPQLAAGGYGYGGLLLGRYPGVDALHDAMDALRAMGVQVVDPHTWELGGHGLDGLLAAAEARDPLALLNPGKLPGRVPAAG